MARARVLLVEDNPVNQFLVRGMLEMLGSRVDTADDGYEALELTAQRRYDLILMDCLMPRMDGLEATRRIRSRESGKFRSGSASHAAASRPELARVPIVAITTNALSRARCLECGMDDHLRKPFDQAQLCAYMERWIVSGSQEERGGRDEEVSVG